MIQQCNELTAVERGAVFYPVGWEDTLGGAGRPQELINKEIRTCDYFVLLLWDRWGTPPDDEAKTSFSSGTEEEFHIAQECLSSTRTPMRDVIVFFKAVEPGKLSDPGEQLQKVLAFRRQLEHSKALLFETFDVATAFAQRFNRHLLRWLFDHEQYKSAKGYKGPERRTTSIKELVNRPYDDLVIPVSRVFSAHERAARGKSPMRQEAEDLVKNGQFTDAELLFARELATDSSPELFREFGDFLLSLGRLSQAEDVFTRLLAMSEFAGDKWKAVAFGRIGLVHRKRGHLIEAEHMHKAAMEIHERLGNLIGVATDLRDLGQIYRRRGDLAAAETAHRRTLEIFVRSQEGDEDIAIQYSNLALIARLRGDLDEAERLHQWALARFEYLQNEQGIAMQLGNLGTILRLRENYDAAEEMHKRALSINETSRWPEGVAIQLGNLAVIYTEQERYELASQMLHKSLSINEQLGRIEGIASDYRDLGLLTYRRGDPVGARLKLNRARDTFDMIGMRMEVDRLEKILTSMVD
jgi:tetratricopeptide (TPR) repeat protein